MMASKVTPATEKGAEVEGVEKEGGTIEAGLSISVRGIALLNRTTLMVPMVVK